MASHHFHPDMGVLGWFAGCQMERGKRSYSKMWCNCRDHSISSHNLRSWTRMSKWNRWITTVSTSTIGMANWLPLHLRSMGYMFWIAFWIGLWKQPNTPISMWAAYWNLRQLHMHLDTIQRSGVYGTASWHKSVSRMWRSCGRSPMLREWLGSVIATAASQANWREYPSLRTSLPGRLGHCSWCTRTYAVPWKQPSEEVDICCSSSTTPRGKRMRTYWSTS